MDISQWLQVIGVMGADEDTTTWTVHDCENSETPQTIRHKATVLSCPRCKSSNTKFCYYNNYSVSQPRYLCRTCKRYWTEGGHLRNVPVGGTSRKTKNKHSSSSSSKKAGSNLSQPKISPRDGQTIYIDFNNPSAYNDGMSEFEDAPFGINFENNLNPHSPNLCSSSFSHDHLPDSSMISMPVYESNSVLSSSFDNHVDYDVKPGLSYGNDMQAFEENATSPGIVFPFEELKPMTPSEYQFDRDISQGGSNGCWDGMMYGGSW